MENTYGSNCKFADDGTIWHRGKQLAEFKDSTKRDIQTMINWTRKWRININMEKCEVCMFANKDLAQDVKQLAINNFSFKYSPTPKLLGVFLDEKIKFDKHINHIERKSNGAMQTIREIKGIAKISRTKLLRIHNSLVRSIVEYACPVWQITTPDNMKKLEAIQRKGLSLCLGLPSTAGRKAMEVEANILPVD